MHPILFALSGLLMTTNLYAALLSTPLGLRWTMAQTWTTVALGTAMGELIDAAHATSKWDAYPAIG